MFRFLRIGRERIKTCGLSFETPLLFSSSSLLFWKRRPFLRPPCHPLFPHPHRLTRERTRPCASRTQRVWNSCLHPSPSPAIRWYCVCCGWRKCSFFPSPVKEKGVRPSPASRCFRATYSRMVKRWRQKTKNSGRARYACALGAEVGGRCTFEKGFPVVEISLQMSDEPLLRYKLFRYFSFRT